MTHPITIPHHLLWPSTLRKIKELVVGDYSLVCSDGMESAAASLDQPTYNDLEKKFVDLIKALDEEMET